jgi:hypothetical protein
MMTEPELVTIGDGASVDNASLIAHINTRGTFRLNPVKVGSYCVLKTMCRLLSGASMDDHSIMLEHTLVLAGETVDKGKVWQVSELVHGIISKQASKQASKLPFART